jgi:spore coat polysaccharide biosynthesis protein SpsF
MRIIAVTQARVGSTRLPGKVLKKIGDSTLLEFHIHRILKSKGIDQLVVATTTNLEDSAIVEIANKCDVPSSRGSVDDVLDRFHQSLKGLNPDYVVRLTSDCPLIDAALIDKVIDYTIERGLDYCSNTLETRYPDGQDIEVFKYTALQRAWQEAKLPSEREHVTPYIWKNSTFKGGTLFTSDNFSEEHDYGHLRMTVDEKADFDVISKIIKELGKEKTWLEYAQYLNKHNEIKKVNEKIVRNEGYTKSLTKEEN